MNKNKGATSKTAFNLFFLSAFLRLSSRVSHQMIKFFLSSNKKRAVINNCPFNIV